MLFDKIIMANMFKSNILRDKILEGNSSTVYASLNLTFFHGKYGSKDMVGNPVRNFVIKMATHVLTERTDDWRIDDAEHAKSSNCSFDKPVRL